MTSTDIVQYYHVIYMVSRGKGLATVQVGLRLEGPPGYPNLRETQADLSKKIGEPVIVTSINPINRVMYD